MRLKRLELQGFKSFVDRTILPFEAGITGVVGPNGCGKSNIVDAIQWVMGEQSAKHLRGSSMSDVIFNGSDTRPATSMAEVSLVMDARGINLPPHLIPIAKGDEIAITRRLYRDGSAEYLLNKNSVRLKDVHEVFMDTGVGRRAYSIIEQGQIDRMINVKPDDRRVIFEEVAGITKYKTKRKEAERKLEQTRLNIERVDDIIRELEKQIRSLKIQATRARKFKEVKTELEKVDLFLLGRKLFSFKETLSTLEKQRQQINDERAEFDAEYSRIEAEATEWDVKRIDQEKSVQEAESQERELALKVQKLENQLALFQQEVQHLEQSKASREVEREEVQRDLQSTNEESASVASELQTLSETLESLKGTISEIEGELDTVRTSSLEGEREREKTQKLVTQNSERVIYLENQIEHGKAKESEFVNKTQELNQKLTDAVVSLDTAKQQLEMVEAKVTECQERGQRVEKEVSEIHRECQEISSRLSDAEEELFAARERYHGTHSKLESLKELQENLEGYSPSAREILLKMEVANATPLAELLHPEPEVEELVEVLLADSMNTLVVDSAEVAKEITQEIRERGLERVGILARNEVNSRREITIPQGATPLLSKVRVESGYETVAEKWLGNIFLVESDSVVFELRSQHPDATFITRDAMLAAHSNRIVSCGTTPTRQGIFARKRQIEELELSSSQLQAEVNSLSEKRETLLAQLESQEKRHDELKDSLSSLHVEAVGYRKEREKIQIERDRADKEYVILTEDAECNSKDLDSIRLRLEEWNSELEQVSRERGEAEEKLKDLETRLEQVKLEILKLQSDLSEKNVERSKLEERVVGLEEKNSSLESQKSQLTARRTALEEKEKECLSKIEQIEEDTNSVRTQRDESSEIRNKKVAELAESREEHARICHLLTELREKKDSIQAQRQDAVNQGQELEIRYTQEQSNYEHEKNISLERYNREATPQDESAQLDLEEVPLLKQQVKNEWLSLPTEEKDSLMDEHVENLRKKVARYGEVNLTAINEFDEVQKRHDFLLEQKLDLENSIKILEQAIKRIDETTKERFADTFTGVNEKFQEVFPILFNGGKAKLALTQPDNLLESGVDIMAQPPGKRLQSINLLSGGEKALTAVSLVLAIFARKPSPFCLLDEVDAPLDEANVSRFNTVIRRMAKKSQFILVTHNRKTMDIVDALFGVTMEQAGISKMTSVRLN